jgi:hypothetical protein
MNEPAPEQLPYTESEIESMAADDAEAGRFLTKMMVFTFCYTIIVGAYVIYWSLQN